MSASDEERDRRATRVTIACVSFAAATMFGWAWRTQQLAVDDVARRYLIFELKAAAGGLAADNLDARRSRIDDELGEAARWRALWLAGVGVSVSIGIVTLVTGRTRRRSVKRPDAEEPVFDSPPKGHDQDESTPAS